MKTYKVIFMAFATMILGAFVMTSCSNEENTETQANNNFSKREGILDLSEDSDFIELYNLFLDYEHKNRDVEQINYFLEQGEELSNEEIELFANSMGYESREEASEYAQRFVDLSVSLNDRYAISDMGQEELGDIFIAGFENFETYSNNCERRRRNCFAKASAAATTGHIACYALDLTVVLGLLCHGAVTVAWVAANDDCQLDYEDCIEDQTNN